MSPPSPSKTLLTRLSALLTPHEALDRLAHLPYPFLLESPRGLGRYSLAGADPFGLLITAPNGHTTLKTASAIQHFTDSFAGLRATLDAFCVESCSLPFCGGAVGFLGYGLRRWIEKVPCQAPEDLDLPHMVLGLYDTGLVFDHETGDVTLFSTGLPSDGPQRNERAKARTQAFRELLEAPGRLPVIQPKQYGVTSERPEVLHSSFTKAGYVEAIEQIREFIAAGDVYQVNLSQRFSAPLRASPHSLYTRLTALSPAPFAAFFETPHFTLLSSSPEEFLHLDGGRVRTRPIKGTRPRGGRPAGDTRMANALIKSPKDQAEHLMIVDLLRNDLGRVCRQGSITVKSLAELESFAQVHHLTSTICGELASGKDSVDLLRATFPGGSITGAPKIRAMEIIDLLEPVARGPYTGAIGYIGFNQSLHLSIAIRTVVVTGGQAYFHAGGGVVYDSDPLEEYKETLDKARGIRKALDDLVSL